MEAGAPDDYFPLCGLHHGFMPELVRITEINLLLLCQFWAEESKNLNGKLQPTTKTDRITFIQEGIELIRPSFDLESLAGVKPEPVKSANNSDESNVDSDSAQSDGANNLRNFSDFLETSVFNSQNPKLDVLFELMEWNLAGPQLPEAFGLMWRKLIPPEYSQWLSQMADQNPDAGQQVELVASLGKAEKDGSLDGQLLITFERLCQQLTG